MEEPVSGIRKTFLRDLTEDYLKNQTNSFLYKEFWRENMTGLLKTYFPELLEQWLSKPEDARRLLSEAMKKLPEWRRGDLLLQEAGTRQRRDFWEELWLNDAGYRAELITDTEYYLWLVQYLAAHSVYYKTNIYYYKDERRDERAVRPGYPWLYGLLREGLGMDEGELKREITARKEARKKTRKQSAAVTGPSEEEAGTGLSGTDVEEALAMLAEQIQADRDKIASRLHKLRCVVRDKDGRRVKKDYLRWLTARLERMALHVKIKNWLQDSGYPLVGFCGTRKPPKKERKSDFTMRLFEAWCDSPKGYELYKKAEDGEADGGVGIKAESGDWHLEGKGFCVLSTDPDQLRALLEDQATEQGDPPHFYLPLAVHLRSGCVLFLAGKGNYEKVYQGDKHEDDYRATQRHYCFDYLRLIKDRPQKPPGDGTFCLSPAFHENAKEKYKDVLDAFKDYCEDRFKDSPLLAVREYNGLEPAGFPENLFWAFDI